MKRKFCLLLLIGILVFIYFGQYILANEVSIGMAVEFMDHAASAYICQDKGWFAEEDIELSSYESYVTGMALASALARGDVQVAYICLVPAINIYANAKIPIKIIAGTHKYGYGLVVNLKKVEKVQDLEKTNIRIGCVREGGAVDVLLHKTIDKYSLDEKKLVSNIQRMNPPKQILAIQMGKLDAAFLPEQWATLAEKFGFKMLLKSQDIWPEMQGSVLIVKEDLIKTSPEVVKKIFMVNERATHWINQNMFEAAEIVNDQLQKTESNLYPKKTLDIDGKFMLNHALLLRSMKNLDYTININQKIIQETIDYMKQLGYIKNSFDANDILDLRFLNE
jgi:NitT/TauT family transport system substrate-binding protein